jgi:hypothetical protein
MSEQTGEATATDADTPTEGAEGQKPTETVDYWKQRSRENEARAKANAGAAKRLAEIEEASKSEAQKTADRLAAAEKDAVEARREALRMRVASKHSISEEDADLFLTGADEATLTKQAERLAGREADRKKQGNHVPREGGTIKASAHSDEREIARQLFGGGS